MIRVVAAVLLGMFVHASAVGAQDKPVNPQAAILADFKDRIDKYVELRGKADDSAPAQKKTPEPSEIKDAQHSLGERVGVARKGAKQGDIFSPDIAAYFRTLLRPEMKTAGAKDLVKDDNPGNIPFKVNGPYPEKEPLSTVPPKVLASLPQLPKDIEYRFVGKHLILRDARANLIIDYVPNAIS